MIEVNNHDDEKDIRRLTGLINGRTDAAIESRLKEGAKIERTSEGRRPLEKMKKMMKKNMKEKKKKTYY